MARGRSHKRKNNTDEKPHITGPAVKKQKRDEDRKDGELPRKKFYRQRAHANPFSDHALTYPANPQSMDWSSHYPAFVSPPSESSTLVDKSSPREMMKQVEVADIGCGFGGLLFALAPKIPEKLILGMEIRTSVSEFVDNKIRALCAQQSTLRKSPKIETTTSQTDTKDPNLTSDSGFSSADAPATDLPGTTSVDSSLDPAPDATATNDAIPGGYNNISVLRANTMKFLPNFFNKSQLSAIYLCFPDPHFKARKHKARIVSEGLLSEYAYVIRPRGLIYTITDVEDLASWMDAHFGGSELFGRVKVGGEEERPKVQKDELEGLEGAEKDNERDGGVLSDEERIGWEVMHNETEEGKKVTRFGGKKFASVWRRLPDPPWPDEADA